MDSLKEGFDAYYSGIPEDENPFPAFSTEWKLWDAGWWDAFSEDIGTDEDEDGEEDEW